MKVTHKSREMPHPGMFYLANLNPRTSMKMLLVVADT